LPGALLAAWLLWMIALPIIHLAWGRPALTPGVMFGVILQAALAAAVLASAWGWRRMSRAAVGVLILSWLAEFIGSRTGIPFGPYHYEAALQPQLGGVPWVVPLAWLMMLPPAWAIGRLAISDRWPRSAAGRRLAQAVFSALGFTAWDLFLDPQMVAWGFWTWEQPGGYFGIPWVNFLGWLLVSGLLTWIIHPGELPAAPLSAIYAATWVLQTVGQIFFWGLPGPASCGFFAMGLWVLLARRSRARSQF
jgi:putative membrane protein